MDSKALKIGGAALTGLVSSYFEAYGIIFIFVGVAICFDIITGLVKAVAIGEPINSKKATKGFWKKTGLILALGVGLFLDAFLSQLAMTANIKLEFSLPFALIIACYIILNELISTCENIFATNALAMPKWIEKLLIGYKKDIEDIEPRKENEKNEQN